MSDQLSEWTTPWTRLVTSWQWRQSRRLFTPETVARKLDQVFPGSQPAARAEFARLAGAWWVERASVEYVSRVQLDVIKYSAGDLQRLRKIVSATVDDPVAAIQASEAHHFGAVRSPSAPMPSGLEGMDVWDWYRAHEPHPPKREVARAVLRDHTELLRWLRS